VGATDPVGSCSVPRAGEPVGPPVVKRPKNRKAQIALVAAELFCRRGYHGVGVDEIAAAVGISGPAVYRHFPNKYAILMQATHDLVEAAQAVVADALDGPAAAADPHRRLDDALAGLTRLSVDRRKVTGLYQWEARYLTPEHQLEFRAELSELVGRLAEVLRQERPDLTHFSARLLTRGALSVISSPATHRAALGRGRGEPLLRRGAWVVLTAPGSDILEPTSSVAAPATGPEAVTALATGSGSGSGSGLATGSGSGLATGSGPGSGQAAGPGGGGGQVVGPRAGGGQVIAPPVGVSSRREILLAEAITLFHRQGYHSVGIEDIGRAAGINASSVYRYFPSKADLLAAIYYRAAEQVTAATSVSLAEASDLEDALWRLVGRYGDLTFRQSELVAVYQAENNNLPAPDRHELRKVQRLQVEEWVRLVVGIRPELTPADARVLVHAALNLINDLGAGAPAPPPPGLEAQLAGLALSVLRES